MTTYTREHLETLTVLQLKDIVRQERYKSFARLRRDGLIDLIINQQNRPASTTEQKNVKQLRQEAKQLGIRNFARMRKPELVERIREQQNAPLPLPSPTLVERIREQQRIPDIPPRLSPTTLLLQKQTVKQLKQRAKELGIRNFARMRKPELVERIAEQTRVEAPPVLPPTPTVSPPPVLPPTPTVSRLPSPVLPPLPTVSPPPPPVLPPTPTVSRLPSPVLPPTPTVSRLPSPVLPPLPTVQSVFETTENIQLVEREHSPVIEIIRPVRKKKKAVGSWGKRKTLAPPVQTHRRRFQLPPIEPLPPSHGRPQRQHSLSETDITSDEMSGLELLRDTHQYTEISKQELSKVLNTIQELPSEQQYIRDTPNINRTIVDILLS